ncbi:hypothetical protein HMPREF0765_0451 [Sphingobacterium spiritivorum ATCC 33300]|uniref:Uncharacterized protein n=1 Tax=Sphingobacterium spiritivorum ATCC 33300 TaxID=525372 RepID=C2FSZ5_SPHSI|nr:hypothetical protein [Sphingobacterium spiritivorum]EEI94119.1 hypothetical protein HMPREF0765_0451 [Sphingobacterium spiritivorum ATCC 33300]QQS94395.1 hypothetical protein I6J03_13415 [Sphingobacterium spiritivorum]
MSSEIIKKYNLKLASSSPNIKADITKEFNTSSELISYLDRTDQLLSSENARFASVDYFDKSYTIKIIDGRYDLSGNRGVTYNYTIRSNYYKERGFPSLAFIVVSFDSEYSQSPTRNVTSYLEYEGIQAGDIRYTQLSGTASGNADPDFSIKGFYTQSISLSSAANYFRSYNVSIKGNSRGATISYTNVR